MSWGLTKQEGPSLELTRDLSYEVVFVGKSAEAFN